MNNVWKIICRDIGIHFVISNDASFILLSYGMFVKSFIKCMVFFTLKE